MVSSRAARWSVDSTADAPLISGHFDGEGGEPGHTLLAETGSAPHACLVAPAFQQIPWEIGRMVMRIAMVLGVAALVAWSSLLTPAPVAAQWSEVTDQRLTDPDKEPQNWLTYYRSYGGWRYSPLTQINAQNIKRLTPRWMLSLGEAGNQQATPLVNNGVMIVTSPLGTEINRVYAVDAGTGRVLWKHETKLPEDLTGLVKILSMNRGAALYGDRVYFGTMDARVVALSAKTGAVVWQKTLADTTAPVLA